MKIQAVICDMDGVLVDTEKYLAQFWVQAAREAGYDFKREHALMLRSLNMDDAGRLMQSIFGEGFDYPAVRAYRKELEAAHYAEHPVELKPQVPETLDALRTSGVVLAVATATDMDRAMDRLSQAGLDDRFDRIISAHMVARGKPYPDIYLYACEQLGLTPASCVAVEDSPNGVTAARRAGLVTIMVPDLTRPDEMLLPMIDYVVPDFSWVARIVGQLNA